MRFFHFTSPRKPLATGTEIGALKGVSFQRSGHRLFPPIP